MWNFYLLFHQTHQYRLIFDTVFSMSVCVFNSLLNEEYSNLFNSADFSSKYFSSKASLPIKHLYLLIFTDVRAEILAVCLSKSY